VINSIILWHLHLKVYFNAGNNFFFLVRLLFIHSGTLCVCVCVCVCVRFFLSFFK
jgi:hypothetical protein